MIYEVVLLVVVLTKGSTSIPAGGKCTTTADCVAPNVCSKWGWCQWTSIYGEDGPSQGSSAPGGGRAGQCKTSADCASRVPYCSKLGYCHGGTLPFDEAQLEIADGDKNAAPRERPIGFVNNNVRKNSPIFLEEKQTNSGNNQRVGTAGNKPNSGPRRNNNRQRPSNGQGKQSGGGSLSNQECPGSLEECIDTACVPLENVDAYVVCVKACGKRCNR